MTTSRTFAALMCAVAVAACSKNAVQDITAAPPSAAVVFFNYATGAPSLNFYANSAKVTAVSSNTAQESNLGTAYGAAAAGGNYTGLAAGQYTFSGRITAATDNGLAIATLPAPLADGKYYSFYTSGIYNTTTKQADAFIVEDPLPAWNYTVAYVRFVNAISNSQPMTLYAKSQATGSSEVAVGATVAYKGAGTYVTLAPGNYDLSARASGSASNLITRTNVGFGPGRVYTIGARGDMTVTSSTAANRPILEIAANR